MERAGPDDNHLSGYVRSGTRLPHGQAGLFPAARLWHPGASVKAPEFDSPAAVMLHRPFRPAVRRIPPPVGDERTRWSGIGM